MRARSSAIAKLVGGIAILAPWGVGCLRAQEPDRAVRMTPALRSALFDLRSGERLSVIVELERVAPAGGEIVALRSQAALLLAPITEEADRGEFTLLERWWVVPAALVEADSAAIEALAMRPDVRRIYLDDRIPVSLEPSRSVAANASFVSAAMQTVGADAVWPAGVTGEGVTVAIFDSGVEVDNAMLGGRWRGHRTSIRASWFDPFYGASKPVDRIGHGSQVAAAAVGALATGDSLLMPDGSVVVAASDIDVVTGTAPRAEWIAARIFDLFGGAVYTRRSVILQAFQWALDPDGDPRTDDAPAVINNSWGALDPQDFDVCNDIVYTAIDAAEAAGIAVVFAAGNFGPDPETVIAPAARDDPELVSFAVGATEGTGSSVTVADFSSRGPSPCGGGIKPNMVAPGRVPEVRTATAGAARLTGFSLTGTSFSTAIVSGALALVRQARPGATPKQAKEILLATARSVDPPEPNNNSGAGLLDVPAAVQQANPGFAGPLVQIEAVEREAGALHVTLANRGTLLFEGGRLAAEVGARPVASVAVGRLDPGERRTVGLEIGNAHSRRAIRLLVADGTGRPLVTRTLLGAPPDLTGGFVLTAGGLEAGGNDFGRLGQIAAPRGFVFRGQDLLTGGSFFLAANGRISDGIYLTVEGLPGLKAEPPAAETDWAPVRHLTDVSAAEVTFQFDDGEALVPLGVSVDVRMQASEQSGVAALEVVAVVRNTGTRALSNVSPGVFADWDLAGGETVEYSVENEALIARPLAGGPEVAILAGEGAPRGFAAVPLGTPDPFGSYVAGSGVLADGEFADSTKARLAEGGTAANLPGAGTAEDQSQLLSVGPLAIAIGASELVRFWLLVADDESAAVARLTELRAAAPIPPPTPGPGLGLVLLPPFPNPLTIGQGSVSFPYTVSDRLRRPGAEIVFEIYDVSGRRLVSQTLPIGGAGPLTVPTWDGMLGGSRPAAAGVYPYVFRLGDQTQSGRIMLLH